MPCPDPSTVLAFVGGTLAPGPRDELERHLDGCDRCRAWIAELARVESSQPHVAPIETTLPSGGDHAVEALPEGARVDRFLVVRRLGMGAMGVVYAAYDPVLDRRCALKLLRPQARGEEAQQRLMREARALARLNCPNVIAVHEVGTWRGRVFLAMEFVDGPTLAAWLRGATHSPREILEVFLQAGRGLAAAHAQGLVHRDFKPDNVLVGRDGRVRVTDFGLARAAAAAEAMPQLASPAPDPAAPALTHTGAVVGTPAYMAPEQIDGAAVDARADQFAFCVSLYEALYGHRPFHGETLGALAQATRSGRLELPGRPRLPKPVQRVLARGLRPLPADRFESMQHAVDALAAATGREARRRLAAAATLGMVAAAAAGAAGLAWRQTQLCRGSEARLAGVWDPPRRLAVRKALEATGLAYAPGVAAGVERTLDVYAASWVGAHREACEATRLRGEQPEDVLGLRMECLGRRRAELDALVALLAAADAKLAQNAVQAAVALAPVSSCGDVEVLRSRVKPPANDAARAAVERVSARLARAKALLDGGRYAAGVEEALKASEEAQAAGYRPMQAEAGYLLGRLQEKAGRAKDAEAALEQAVLAAESSGHKEMEARAWSELVTVLGSRLRRPDEAQAAGRHAAAAIEALGGDELLEAQRLYHLGNAQWSQAKYREALESHQRALAIRERRLPAGDLAVAQARVAIGVDHSKLGGHAAAAAAYRGALAIQEALLGPDHPDVATTVHNLGATLWIAGELDEALASIQRALAIRQRSLPSPHVAVCASLDNLGAVYSLKGEHARAEEYLRQAVDECERALGPEDPVLARALGNQAEVLLREGKLDAALAAYERSAAIREKRLGPDHPDLAFALEGIGKIRVAQGNAKAAVAPLERALRLWDRGEHDPVEGAELRLAVASALWASGADRRRARDLAEQARAACAAAPTKTAQERLGEAEKWLRDH